jgi:putative FmdB family regulatory protein
MPLYEFECQECRRQQELLVQGSQKPYCESCGSTRLTKLLSVVSAHSAGSGRSSDAPPAGPCGSSCGCFPTS